MLDQVLALLEHETLKKSRRLQRRKPNAERRWRGWQASAQLHSPHTMKKRWLGEVTMHLVAGLSHGTSKVDVFAANWPPTSSAFASRSG